MRTLISCFLLALVFLSFTSNAEAQVFKKLKKKAKKSVEAKVEQKLESEMEKKIDQMVESSWKTVFGDLEQDAKDGKNPLFMLNSNVTTEDSYRFDTITTMEIKTDRRKGKSDQPMIMEMHFNEDELYTGTKFSGEDIDKKNGEFFIIYDFKNSAMVMLMDSEDEKISFAYDWQQTLQNAEDITKKVDGVKENEEEVDWDEVEEWNGYTKIGTKNIAGYSADGYRSENEHGIMEIWVTRDIAYGMNSMFQANVNSKQLRGKVPSTYPYGMLMEMVSEDQKSGDKTTMKVTNIQKNANVTYSMSDYPTMSLDKKEGQ